MTNEQLGREWCGRYGKRPHFFEPWDCRPMAYLWHTATDYRPVYPPPPGSVLPRQLIIDTTARHQTEAEAYAAVGAALREVERLGAEVRAILGVEVIQ